MTEEGPKPPELEQKEKINLRVLFAEDSESVREFIGKILQEKYSFVKIVENGQQLIDEIANSGNIYDVVVSDNSMPLKNGINVLREIRSSNTEYMKNLPFILLTAAPYPALEEAVRKLDSICINKANAEKDLATQIEKSTSKS